jgi:predicted aspartyl protease
LGEIALIFNYKREGDPNDPKGFTLQPMIRVSLFCNGKHESLRCVIDTGATDCMFHSSIAKSLGIDLTSGKPKTFYAVNGQPFNAYLHNVELKVHRLDIRIRIQAAFTEASKESLLGQNGFFDYFEVTFRRFRNEMDIKPRPRQH